MPDIKYIPPDFLETLREKADILEVAQHFQPELKRRGTSYVGECPSCNSDKMNIAPAKDLVKCFRCNQSGKGAIGYLTQLRGMSFVDACKSIAELYNLTIPETDNSGSQVRAAAASGAKSVSDSAFRDDQLRASGIPDGAQVYNSIIGKEEKVLNRYTAGSLDFKGNPVPGPDMLLHYLNLDGHTINYRNVNAKKDVPYIRIRFANPELHKDKGGDPIRYKSPTNGGNHLWLPEWIRRAFAEKTEIKSLVFVEGEKKADALCLAGIPAVGIAGIHNFAVANEMPSEIERLMLACRVKEVIFFLDSDFENLGGSLDKHADTRPRTFYRAVSRFQKYFRAYATSGMHVSIYFAHGIDKDHKGADDLIEAIKQSEKTKSVNLSGDLDKALHSHTYTGDHIKAYDITDYSDYQLMEIWNLHSPRAFMERYKDDLMKVPEFRIKGIRYQYNKEDKRFDVSQKLLPSEKFWFEKITKYGTNIEFDYLIINDFLNNRGYALYEIAPGRYHFIHTENNIVTVVDAQKIQRFVYEFTRSIEEFDVLRMLMKGGTSYLGPDRLKNLYYHSPAFVHPERNRQILCFKNGFWIITPDGIEEKKYNDLPGCIWRDDIIDFEPQKIDDFIKFEVNDPAGDHPEVSIECKTDNSDIVQYITATSDILWRTPDHETRMPVLFSSMADKMIAAGYILSSYLDPANLKAIICMDAAESESGRSEGGTGKSIFATMFEHAIPTHVISAKAARLTEDAHLYEGVDERTRAVVFDDCRRTLDFESFLSDITRGIRVNPKGTAKFFIGPRRMIFTTNHSIRGNDRSFVRRQYIIAFSDYFNGERTPYDIGKRSLFTEWEFDQWNYFYNFLASCIQIYMNYGLRSFAPDADIVRRKQRDDIGETMLEFLEFYFYKGSNYMNRRCDVMKCLNAYWIQYPEQRKYTARKHLKQKIQVFCQYSGYEYNPPDGKRLRNGTTNVEYFIIGDEDFVLEDSKSIFEDDPTF